jgi:hypothetical protein
MARTRQTRAALAGAGAAVALVAGALTRRRARRPDAARETFLAERRARIEVAHLQLVARPDGDGA